MTIRNLRWWIVGLLLVISVKNYIDRQMLSVLAPTIQADLQMSDQQYGVVISLFLAAYTLAYLVSGRMVDAFGARVSLAVFVGVWSVASAMTGFARSVFAIGSWRALLGLGEAGGYTASPKVVAEWFPPRERGVAVSIYSMGASVGATIAPVLIIALSTHYGWRSAFMITGVLGGVLVIPWLILYRRITSHPWLGPAEREHILRGQEAEQAPEGTDYPDERSRWRAIITSPTIWALMAARMLTDPVWYFFQFWLPKYLHSVRGFSQLELSSLWLIFLAADVGFMGGGALSDWLIRRGSNPRTARLCVMAACALLVPIAPLIAGLSSITSVFAVAMIVVMAQTAWLTCNATYVMDLVPKPIFATAFGFISAGSALAGIAMNQAVAWTVGHFSYGYCFYAMVLLHPLGLALIWLFARKPWGQETEREPASAT